MLKRAIKLRWLEKQNEKNIPESAIAYAFHPILKKHSSLQLLPDRNGSYVGAIIRFFIERAWINLRTKAWRETPEATKMFDTAITNLLNPEMIAKRIATDQAFRKSEIWKNSGGYQNSLEGLIKGRRLIHGLQSCTLFLGQSRSKTGYRQGQNNLANVNANPRTD